MADKSATEENMQKAMEAATSKPASPLQMKAPPSPMASARTVSPTARSQAQAPVEIKDEFPYDVAFKISFLGTGQGGSRVANAFYDLGYRRVGVFNTTDMDFEGLSPAIPKLALNVAGGARKDAAFAREQLRGREEAVWDLLIRAWGDDTDYGLICASLGGGTGTGTITSLIDIARRYLNTKHRPPRIGAIISLPRSNEGQQQARNAVNGFRELLQMKVSPLIIIDNDKINKLYRPFADKLYPTANETVSVLFHLFNQLAAARSPYLTFDRSELGQLMDGGIVVMGVAEIDQVSSPADISEKIRDELTNNVLVAVDLKKGRKGACLFVAHPTILSTVTTDYFDAGFTQLDRIVGSAYPEGTVSTVIHRGLYPSGPADRAVIQCYTMISELEPPLARLNELTKEAGMLGSAGESAVAKFLGIND